MLWHGQGHRAGPFSPLAPCTAGNMRVTSGRCLDPAEPLALKPDGPPGDIPSSITTCGAAPGEWDRSQQQPRKGAKVFQCQGNSPGLSAARSPMGRTRQESSSTPANAAIEQRSLPAPGPSDTTVPQPGLCWVREHEQDAVTAGTKDGSCCQTGRAKPEPSTTNASRRLLEEGTHGCHPDGCRQAGTAGQGARS